MLTGAQMANNPDRMLEEAREGDLEVLGQLLELYRRYLSLIARVQIGHQLQGKIDASDVVQEAFLQAHKDFPQFEGDCEAQFVVWLRQIMTRKLSNLVRHFLGTKGRDPRREQQLQAHIDHSSAQFDRGLLALHSTPSQHATKREQAVLLADALCELPPDYREVLVLRNLEGLKFPEVAERMDRSLESVQKLWMRALVRLREVFGEAE